MTALGERLELAVGIARRAHAGQVRKGTDQPYFSHPLAVASLILEHGGTEAEAIAGLLHDTAEDGGGTEMLEEISETIGPDVAAMVEECSDSLVADASAKAPWFERKLAYLDGFEHKSPGALMVTAADKCHNIEAIGRDLATHGEELWDRFNSTAGRSGVIWYYTRVVEELRARVEGGPPGFSRLVARLESCLASVIDATETNAGPLDLEPWRRREAGQDG